MHSLPDPFVITAVFWLMQTCMGTELGLKDKWLENMNPAMKLSKFARDFFATWRKFTSQTIISGLSASCLIPKSFCKKSTKLLLSSRVPNFTMHESVSKRYFLSEITTFWVATKSITAEIGFVSVRLNVQVFRNPITRGIALRCLLASWISKRANPDNFRWTWVGAFYS